MAKWKCTVCGYIHEGEMTDDFKCPKCKVPASKFEKIELDSEIKKQKGNCRKAFNRFRKPVYNAFGIHCVCDGAFHICYYRRLNCRGIYYRSADAAYHKRRNNCADITDGLYRGFCKTVFCALLDAVYYNKNRKGIINYRNKIQKRQKPPFSIIFQLFQHFLS